MANAGNLELNVNIDPDQINKTLTLAIAKSAIGENLKKVIDNEVQRLSASYDNPIKSVVANEINILLTQIIRDEYSEEIKKIVKEKISEDFINDLTSKLWEKFTRNYY